MQEFKVGDKVLVEAEIVDKSEVNLNKYQIDIDCYEYSSYAWVNGKNIIHPDDITTKTYEDGMTKAWELARRIAWDPDRVRVFGTFDLEHIFKDHTWQEAAAKIKAYEDAQEICVGDVVKITTGTFEGVVTKVKEEGCYVIFGDGSSGKFKKSAIKKIGRTIDIAGLLAEIGGAE